jgi:hypothetical protein
MPGSAGQAIPTPIPLAAPPGCGDPHPAAFRAPTLPWEIPSRGNLLGWKLLKQEPAAPTPALTREYVAALALVLAEYAVPGSRGEAGDAGRPCRAFTLVSTKSWGWSSHARLHPDERRSMQSTLHFRVTTLQSTSRSQYEVGAAATLTGCLPVLRTSHLQHTVHARPPAPALPRSSAASAPHYLRVECHVVARNHEHTRLTREP